MILDQIGEYGYSCKLPTKKLFIFINVFLSIMIIMFWIIGMVAWTEEPSTLTNAAWGHANYNYNRISGIGGVGGGEQSVTTIYEEIYAGLLGYYSITTATGESQSVKAFHKYADCNPNFCSPCMQSGQLALGLLIVSFFLSVALSLITLLRAIKDNAVLKLSALLCSFVTWIFSVASFAAFYDMCINTANSDTISVNMVTYRGFSIVVAGWVVVTLIFFIHLFTPCGQQISLNGESRSNNYKDDEDSIEFTSYN